MDTKDPELGDTGFKCFYGFWKTFFKDFLENRIADSLFSGPQYVSP